ncbi:MAG: ion channel [Bacillota bacterium]
MIVTAFCFRRQIYLVKRILKKAASIKFFTEFIIIVFLLYILIVTFFGTLYFFIALFFRPEVSYFEWFYFSAITLTTVGFGDIIPLNSFMKLLVSIESFIGYIFPSVVFTIGLGIILRQNKI